MRLPPLLSGLPARVRHREVECQTAVTAKRKFKAAAHRLAVRLAMPPVDVSSQNLRERSLQVSAPRVPAGGVHGEENASAHFMCLATALASLNIVPPPKTPSILPTLPRQAVFQ